MSKTRIMLFGSSGHAGAVMDTVRKQGEYEIAGIVDPNVPVGTIINGCAVLGHEGEIGRLVSETGIDTGFVAVGDNATREKIVASVSRQVPAFRFATVIHPSAILAHGVSVGQGVLIMAGAVVNSGARIENHAILNTRCVVEHDCSLDDFCHVSPGAVLGGNVHVGKGAQVGIGATVIQGVSIGSRSLLGAGGAAVRDVPENSTYVGVPAKPKK